MFKVIFSFLLFGVVSMTAFADPTCTQWQPGDFSPNTQSHHLIAPSYGLYWLKYDAKTGGEDQVRAYTPNSILPYGTDGTPTPKTYVDPNVDNGSARDAYNAALPKGFFDPKKPTIIFFHGWQPGKTSLKQRFDLCYQYPKADGTESDRYNTLKYWSGWNVAIFYWTPFADEKQVADAERKIYSTTSSSKMRWAFLENGVLKRTTDTNACKDYQCYSPKMSVAALAYAAVKAAMPAHYRQELRISGQSLGAQLAILVTGKLLENPAGPQPTRLILMDPYFSRGNLGLFQTTVAQHANLIVDSIIAHNVPVAEYRTSTISSGMFGDWDNALMQKVAYMRLYPKYLKVKNPLTLLEQQHRSASYLYFQSLHPTSKKVEDPYWDPADGGAAWNKSFIDAKATNAQVEKMMGYTRFQQSSATHMSEYNFPHTEDDVFNDKDVSQ